ncbi:MAG: DUF3881 family protein [Lachnospiraceae bacterium]|nr:DUF3881 family protein [Lachnospiraceae bacterium]
MHRYMRAVGFSQLSDRNEVKQLLTDIVLQSTSCTYTTNSDNIILAEFNKNYADNIGVAVCGEFDKDDKFIYEYFYPYMRGSSISTSEDVSVERHASQESYAGVCDDIRIGVSLIFYLQNMITYVKLKNAGKLPVRNTNLTLSGLSIEGTILFPIIKNEHDRRRINRANTNRSNLIQAARQGDEEAIESLTIEDMDTYTTISKRINTEDVFSLVDTFFMPYGVECDHYSIMGEILDSRLVHNSQTGEGVYQLAISCNDINIDICINENDLLGEPEAGRRFKGVIWAQGFINFPEE